MEDNLHKPIILIVDDEEGIGRLFKETLEEVDYICQTAANRDKAPGGGVSVTFYH